MKRFTHLFTTCIFSTLISLYTTAKTNSFYPPAISITATPSDSVCAGNTVTLKASGATNYTWAPAAKISGPDTGATVIAKPTVTTTYTVTGTVGRMRIKQTITITVIPLPTITITSHPSYVCTGVNDTLIGSGSPASYTWVWKPCPYCTLIGKIGDTLIATYADTYTLTATNSFGCSSTKSITVATSPTPTVTVTGKDTICSGDSTKLTASGGGTSATYLWSTGSTNNPITVSPTSNTTYTVTETNGKGCEGTGFITVIVNPLPAVAITPPKPTICKGNAVTLTGSGASTYKWSTGSTNDSIIVSPTVTHTYTLTGRGADGCKNTTTAKVTVDTLPKLKITPASANSCNGKPIVLSASGAVTYTWSPAIGLSTTTGSTVTVTIDSTIIYIVTGTDSNGCSNTKTAKITNLPKVKINPSPSTICSGSSSIITASGAKTYSWSPSTSLSSTTGAVVTATPTVTTTYTLIATNAMGCTDTNIIVITVNPVPIVSATVSSATICAGVPDTLKAFGASTYTWTPNTKLSTSTGNLVISTPNSTTTYTVTGTNTFGCSSTASITITVNPTPVVNADTDLVHYITGGSLAATGGTPPYTYTWAPIPSSLLPLPDTTTTYTLTVTDAKGCRSRDITTFVPTPNAAGPCGAIFISAYVQDTINRDNAIELYNPTKNPINLNNYYLVTDSLYAPPIGITLIGSIPAHGTFVIANNYADTALTHKANMLTANLNLNGTDVVALAHIIPTKSSVHITELDQIGDPIIPFTDSGWVVGSGSTRNHTLVRKSYIDTGTTNWSLGMNEWNVYPQGTFSVLRHYNNVCSQGDPEINFTIQDLPPTCGNPSYVNFEVMVTSSPSTVFNNTVVNIKYAGSEFSGDSFTNGGIIASRGTSFLPNSGNDYNIFDTATLAGDSVMALTLGNVSDSSVSGTVLDSLTPQVLFHVSLRVQNSCQTDSVNFTNLSSSSYYASTTKVFVSRTAIDSMEVGIKKINKYCCNFDTLGDCIDSCVTDTIFYWGDYTYDSTFNYVSQNYPYNGSSYLAGIITSSSCGVHLEPFYSSINAGTNSKSVAAIASIQSNSSILTITGYGFGNVRDSIWVSNSDNYGFVTLDSTDIKSWSENRIVVKMPSILINNIANSTGSGPIQVYNSCGGSATGTIQINYNIENAYYSNGEKERPNIVMSNPSQSFIFRCDTSITNNPNALYCVKKALRVWNCYTGVNWKLGNDTILDTAKKDGVSLVFFSNSSSNFPSSGTLMVTSQQILNACNDGTDSVDFYREADIMIKRTQYLPGGKNWSYDTTGTQTATDSDYFYDAILHELGHAHGLGHVNDSLSLMFWHIFAGKRDSIPVGGTYPGPATLLGGLDMIQTSIANSPSSLGGCSSFSVLLPSSTMCKDAVLGVPVVSSLSNGLTIFPNPISGGNITVSYELTKSAYINFKIVDAVGRTVFTINDDNKPPGKYVLQYRTDALAAGVYLFVANINGAFQTIKFIKI